MSKNSQISLYYNFKEWLFSFEKNRKYKKKKIIIKQEDE